MASKRSINLGNIFFWLVLIACAGGAFWAGFWYTYGATVNVATKTPSDMRSARPLPTPLPSETPAAPLTLTKATTEPGPIGTVVPLAKLFKTSPTPTEPPTERPTPVATEAPTAAPTEALSPVPTANAAATEIYRVQVGPFDDRDTAQKQVQDLQAAGINAVVVFDAGHYQAQLGAFSDRARAIAVADEVNERGYSVTIRH
ncbi:MAG TPA: SPOR domain-containing protein [Oscillatoriaceae cyanobacterium]